MGEEMNKSQRHLIDAFMEVREKKPLEKISVVELCKMAEVNKSTFYAYYHDVYDLSDQLQTAAFQKILEEMGDLSTIVFDTPKFTRDILRHCILEEKDISILFSGSESYKLPQKLYEAIMEVFYHYKPEHVGDMKHQIMMSFKVYGAYFAMITNQEFDDEEKIHYIGELTGMFK